jgi:hypothetical protein
VVHWYSFDGPFTITALGTSPFEKVRIQSTKQTVQMPGQVPTTLTVYVATATVQKGTSRGTYRYAIALFADSKLYVDPSCPPIIVEGVGGPAPQKQ